MYLCVHVCGCGVGVAVKMTFLCRTGVGHRLKSVMEMCACASSFFTALVLKEEAIPHWPSNFRSTHLKSDLNTHSHMPPCARHCGKVWNTQEMGQTGCRFLVLDFKGLKSLVGMTNKQPLRHTQCITY